MSRVIHDSDLEVDRAPHGMAMDMQIRCQTSGPGGDEPGARSPQKQHHGGQHMSVRIDYARVAPDAVRAMLGLECYVATSRIEPPLRELVKLCYSLLNGCAFCPD
jgi:hypothetical protein